MIEHIEKQSILGVTSRVALYREWKKKGKSRVTVPAKFECLIGVG